MKKVILAVVLVLTVGLCASAQQRGGRDGFFTDWSDVSNGLDKFDDFNNDLFRGGPNTPGHGGGDTPAPLGSGLLVLTALGAGYAIARRKREE